jgi:signal transduction histidine kinase
MNAAAAMVYWVVVAVWLTVLGTIAFFYVRNPQAFGTTRLLLAVLSVDTFRNVFENVYFGIYFGAQYGIFSAKLASVLGLPILLIIPKLLNFAAGSIVLGLLLLRWLPLAVEERGIAKREKEVAEESSRLKEEFVAIVSHELRTPLTAIAASLALLEDDTEANSSEETKELIAIAHANTHRLRRLVDDILDIARLESGKTSFHLQRIELETLLKQEIEANQSLASKAAVKLSLDVPQGLKVQADPDRLKQVVSNLLSNAIKFSPDGAEVLLTAEAQESKVRISVRDHGPGIPKEFRSRIFEKFAQADMSASRPKTGSGLGLSIVKEIVHRLGGEITFADAPGDGTIFRVDLPRPECVESTFTEARTLIGADPTSSAAANRAAVSRSSSEKRTVTA